MYPLFGKTPGWRVLRDSTEQQKIMDDATAYSIEQIHIELRIVSTFPTDILKGVF